MLDSDFPATAGAAGACARLLQVEAQGSLKAFISRGRSPSGGPSSPRRTSLAYAFTRQPLQDQLQAICDQLGVPYDDGDSCCVLVPGPSLTDPVAQGEAQLIPALGRHPVCLWRLADLVAERLGRLAVDGRGALGVTAEVLGVLRSLVAACTEPQFALEVVRQDGLNSLLQAALQGGQATSLAVVCVGELCRYDEARAWLGLRTEHLSQELFLRLLALVFPPGQGSAPASPSTLGAACEGADATGACRGSAASGPRRAGLSALCVCLLLLRELPEPASAAAHAAAAEVAWPHEPAYLRMARALQGEDLWAADAALALLYAIESAAEGQKQLRAKVAEELNAALSMAGQWQPRAVQWMFGDAAVKNRLTWSKWKGLADAIADLVSYGGKPDFQRSVRMKITGVRLTGEEEVKSITVKTMREAIDQLTEMYYAAQKSQDRTPRRVRWRRQYQELGSRDRHVLRHLLAASMAQLCEPEGPRPGEAPPPFVRGVSVACSLPDGLDAAPSMGALSGPLDNEALKRYALQAQACGREAVCCKFQRPAHAGGMGLGEADARRALAQLDVVLRVLQVMAPAPASEPDSSPVASKLAGLELPRVPPSEGSTSHREGSSRAPDACTADDGDDGGETVTESVCTASPTAAYSPTGADFEEPPEALVPAAPRVGGKAAAAKGEGKGSAGKGKALKGGKGPPPKAPPKGRPTPDGAPEPTKPDIRLGVEMKPLRWKKLSRTAGTVWASIGDDRELLPAEVVEHWFRKNKVAAMKRPSQLGQSQDNPICVITDARTKTSREISLRCLPPPAEVARALREVDVSILLPEDSEPGVQLESQLERVSAGVPDQKQKQELEAARAAEPERPLGLIESYMWELSRIPAVADRLKCWIYVQTVTDRTKSLCTRLHVFQELLLCFKSPRLQRLLGLFLAVGNYLNAGTKEGRADGFDLDTIKKLDSVKDSQGRDIRHFVMGVFLKHFKPDARQLLKDLSPVLKNVMRRVDQRNDSVEFKKQVPSLESYTEDIFRFQEEYKSKAELLRNVRSFTDDDSDPFTVKMAEEFCRAGKGIEELTLLRKQLVVAYGEVLDWFAACSTGKGEDFLDVFDAQVARDRKRELHADDARCFPRSDDFILLWDNLLVPSELIERKPWLPDVKYKLGPRFCKAREITADDLEDLWETQKMMVGQAEGASEVLQPGVAPSRSLRRNSFPRPPSAC